MNSSALELDRDESTSAPASSLKHTDTVFKSLFDRSADAIWLLDPQAGVFVDCNEAAVKLIGAENKQQLLNTRPQDLSPEFQPDGSRSADKSAEIIALFEKEKTYRFEWMIQRLDGKEVPIEVASTEVIMDGKRINVVISRDISERKKADRDLRELTQSLERRVTERTAELTASEARLRAMVEHAPEAIVVYSADLGRFLFGNQHACDLYGVPMSKLAELTPIDVSPEFQADGRPTSEVALEKIAQVLAGETPVFEWMHRRPNGQLIPTEVRLLRLPAEGQNLIRASIIDNTERKLAERTLRESEAKFRALFEGTSQGIVLHDADQILEVNPAAVRILGCQSPHELIGRHPSETSPAFQQNGESSAAVAGRHIQECMVNGSARFEWMSCTPAGEEIPLEVALTRIQWSGRQIIQAFITDITERTRAQKALSESEARFSVAFQASPFFIGILRMSDGAYVLANDAFVNWVGYAREEIIGRTSAEFGMWGNVDERASALNDMRTIGSIRQREVHWQNRDRELRTILLSAETIKLDDTPHILSFAQDITQRKQVEEELRESEARFSAAFQASPASIGILRVSDEKYVLVNDAHLNWLGYPREEVIGRTCLELGMWDNPGERDLILKDMQTFGSIRQRECRWKNRRGERFTILLSAEAITLNKTPHMIAMAIDITQRKRAEEELLKTLEREKELSQLKSNFVSMVSHEFRTPLGIIQSSGELLRDFHQKMGTDERDAQLASITRNTRRMAGLMEEVLVLSRLDAGKLDFEPKTVDLNLFCHRLVDEVLSATNRRCIIKLSLNSVPTEANADERLLGHVFTNLLSNAVKYSEPGATVHFAIERDGPEAVCVVSDQGIGISEEDQQQLFSAFHRGGNVGTRPGTGLGLLLVKRCAELHGGNVQLNSTIGQGTTVTVKFSVFGNKP
jgi:PAS domain S-box-containing protein